MNNDAVTVALFDETKVQLPSIHKDADFVTLKFDNDVYTVVPCDYHDEPEVKPEEPKKKNSKKKVSIKIPNEDVDGMNIVET